VQCDVAAVVAFLAADGAASVTSTFVTIDGGRELARPSLKSRALLNLARTQPYRLSATEPGGESGRG